MPTTLEELKKKVQEWSGFPLLDDFTGENKYDLYQRISSLKYTLECEIEQQANIFQKEIEEMDLPEGKEPV